MQINVKTNADKVVMEFLAAGRDMRDRAVASALNKTVTQARTAASREIRGAGYNLKAGDVKKAMRMQRATSGQLRASLIASGRPIPLFKYSARATAKGVSVSVMKGRKLIAGAFIATMPNGRRGVFVRDMTKARHPRTKKNKYADLPIKELYGPSIPAALANAKVQDALLTIMNEKFPKILEHECKWLARKLGRTSAA
jgi:Prophage minor tail protein Z (GPZ)